MAEYKLDQLNSVLDVRPRDLLHIRVAKRENMLGDEDRRITYSDFLAGLQLNRFLEKSGGEMTGDLTVTKILSSGGELAYATPTSSYIGNSSKSTVIRVNSLNNLLVSNGSVSGVVYHTLNKPSPNELGLRTNQENEEVFAIKGQSNNFIGQQTITVDFEALVLKNANKGEAVSVHATDSDNISRWRLGNTSSVKSDLILSNSVSGLNLTLGSSATLNRSLAVTGQVTPTDYSNFDSRYIPAATLSNIALKNTANTFTQEQTIAPSSGERGLTLTLVASPSSGLVTNLIGRDSSRNLLWKVGSTGDGDTVLENMKSNTLLMLRTDDVLISKVLRITGQVIPSDFGNFDSRFYTKTLSDQRYSLLGGNNTFTGINIWRKNEGVSSSTPTFIGNNAALFFRNSDSSTNTLYIQGRDSNDVAKWTVGNSISDTMYITNEKLNSQILLGQGSATVNVEWRAPKLVPTDYSNFDSRYFPNNGGNLNGSLNVLGDISARSMHVVSPRTDTGQIFFSDSRFSTVFYIPVNGRVSTWDGTTTGHMYTTLHRPTPAEIGTYTTAQIDQKVEQAAASATDLKKVYPIGIVVWFNSNLNPNTILAESGITGMRWAYLSGAQGRTVRIGNPNGSDVATTGGNDSVTLSSNNIPSHTHTFSATTSSDGEHTHTIRGEDSGSGGSNFGRGNGASRVINGILPAGAHTHTISGTTDSSGSGQSFAVTNAFYRLMAWVRTA